MSEAKLKQLFAAARREPVPDQPAGFAEQVVGAIRHSQAARPAPQPLLEQLMPFFPRLAAVCLLIIGLSLAGAFVFSERDVNLTSDFNQVAEQWLFGPDHSS